MEGWPLGDGRPRPAGAGGVALLWVRARHRGASLPTSTPRSSSPSPGRRCSADSVDAGGRVPSSSRTGPSGGRPVTRPGRRRSRSHPGASVPRTAARRVGAGLGARRRDAVDGVAGLLGALDDPDALVAVEPVVRGLLRRHRPPRLAATGSVWEHVIPAVLGQKVQSTSARRAWQFVLRRFGEPPPGPAPPRLRLPPAPERMLEVGYAELHEAAVERRRFEVIVGVARVVDRIEAGRATRSRRGAPAAGDGARRRTVDVGDGHPGQPR